MGHLCKWGPFYLQLHNTKNTEQGWMMTLGSNRIWNQIWQSLAIQLKQLGLLGNLQVLKMETGEIWGSRKEVKQRRDRFLLPGLQMLTANLLHTLAGIIQRQAGFSATNTFSSTGFSNCAMEKKGCFIATAQAFISSLPKNYQILELTVTDRVITTIIYTF